MSDNSAGTKVCEACGGSGEYQPDPGRLSDACPVCHGTGLDTTGAVVGEMPSTREPLCALCGDTGTVHFKGGDENCAACHARMVLDTGSSLPSTPDPVTDESCRHCNGRGVRSQMQDGTLRIFACECRLPPNVRLLEYIHSPEVSGVFVSDPRDATIAAQAAEIETLTEKRGELRACRDKIERQRDEALATIAALTAERDELRAQEKRMTDILEERELSFVKRITAVEAQAKLYLRVIDGQEAYSASLTMLFARVKAGLPPLPLTLSRDAANVGLELPEEDHD